MIMVRSVQKNGNGSFLYPKGIDTIDEVPWDLTYAISHANKVLSWQENLSSDEMPPSWMWPFDEELELWFEDVERLREEKYSGNGSEEPADMIGNEYSDRFK